MKVIHKDCPKEFANDRSLPRNSYIIQYLNNEVLKFDIVQAANFVEVFDNYYDEFGKGSVQSIKWTNGTVNPRVWGYKSNKKKK